MTIDDVPEEEVIEQSFTITMKFSNVADAQGNPIMPKLSCTPTHGMNPLDCIRFCNCGIDWALEAMGQIAMRHAQEAEKAVARRVARPPLVIVPGRS